jgi:hypothetical protein
MESSRMQSFFDWKPFVSVCRPERARAGWQSLLRIVILSAGGAGLAAPAPKGPYRRLNSHFVILSAGVPLLHAGVEVPAPSEAEGICGSVLFSVAS